MNFFRFNFNNNENKFLNLAYKFRNNVAILGKCDANGLCLFSFKEHAFVDRVFTLILVYRKQFMWTKEFFSDVAIFIYSKFL